MELLIAILLTLLATLYTYITAKEKGLDVKFWVVMAIIFGLIVIPFVFLAKSKIDKGKTDNNDENNEGGYLKA